MTCHTFHPNHTMIATQDKSLFRLILVVGIFCILVLSNGYATKPQSNYSIIDSLSHSAGIHHISFLSKYSIDSCGLTISAHPAAWLLQQQLVSLKKISLYEGNPAQKQRAEVQIEDCAVRYFLYSESGDSLIREGQIITKGVFHKNGNLIEIPQFSAIVRDTIARSDVGIVEIPSYPFTKSIVPEQPKGFFGEVAEPILFVAAAAVTVLLLFTVRSQ